MEKIPGVYKVIDTLYVEQLGRIAFQLKSILTQIRSVEWLKCYSDNLNIAGTRKGPSGTRMGQSSSESAVYMRSTLASIVWLWTRVRLDVDIT